MYKRILLKLSGEALKEGTKESILNYIQNHYSTQEWICYSNHEHECRGDCWAR